MNNQNNGNLNNINFNLSNINNNINRRDSINTNNHYEEIVNTTISHQGNSNRFDENENNDIISMISRNTFNSNNFITENHNHSNDNQKKNMVSSGNLTQVDKIYEVKPSNNNNKDNKNLTNKIEEHLLHNLLGENQNQNILNFNQIQENDVKIQEYMQIKSFQISRNDTVFCLSVDGSVHSEIAYDIVSEDYIKNETDKLIIVHIYNSEMDEYYNFRNKKDTINDKYSTKILKVDRSKVLFLKEDRVSKLHALEQVNRIAANHMCSYLISGYYGIKGPKGDNKELTKGVDYLLSFSKIPTVIIKENILRKNKPNGQIKWLFVFDRAYMNCYSIFNRFLPLINREKDYVFGFTMLPDWINFDDIKKNFQLDMEICKIKNFDYEYVEYKKNPSELVKEKVNFGEILYDYIVFYNNPEKHRNEGKLSDIFNIVTKCASNVCFINGP